jgi:DnaJ-class molecular chaperone
MKEYYSRLFLNDKASLKEVKKAYRKLVKKFHPDKNIESDEYTSEFRLIQEAYDNLCRHLMPKKEYQKQHYSQAPKKETERPKSTVTGVVKSDAKFAEAGERVVDERPYFIFMAILLIVFIVFGVFAAINQTSLIMKIILLALFIPLPVSIFIGYSRKNAATDEK